ncbi:MAG TPA: response regulator, partial [Ktedonobacterales bacterium]
QRTRRDCPVSKREKRILVIDDDPDIALVLVSVVEEEGYQVDAIDGGDYLERIGEGEPPDLILLDMLLSGQDGRQIARRLKRQDATRHIPIVMLSAHPNAEREALDAGADGFLAKPFDIDVLLATIATYLG